MNLNSGGFVARVKREEKETKKEKKRKEKKRKEKKRKEKERKAPALLKFRNPG